MTPEQEQELQEHIQAIAKILYEDTTPEKLTSLAGIQEAVRMSAMKMQHRISSILQAYKFPVAVNND